MATTQTQTVMYQQTALTDDQKQETGRLLQEQLIELLDLALQGKQAHWNVAGPNFRSVHFQLDEMIAEYRTWSDTVAERLVTIGVAARGQAADVREASPLKQLTAGQVRDREVIAHFSGLLIDTIGRSRGRMDRLGQTDLVSQAIIMDIIEGLEKQLWMVRAQEA